MHGRELYAYNVHELDFAIIIKFVTCAWRSPGISGRELYVYTTPYKLITDLRRAVAAVPLNSEPPKHSEFLRSEWATVRGI
jgi:hypothetical protein